ITLDDTDPVDIAPHADAGITAYHAVKKAARELVPGDYCVLIGIGGLGGPPVVVTLDGVADGVGRDVVVSDEAKEHVVETATAFADDNPELVDAYDLDLDFDAWSSVPEGARVVPNDAGLAPGAVVDSVYVLPGVPSEMKAVFERMADDFGGDVVSETVYTPAPEGALTSRLEDLRDAFDVTVGSYPATDEPNRIKVTGTDRGEVERAAQWVRENVETTTIEK
ncbi:competence/damage-inducible protein A, partial [Salarchaeum sp. III]|uniref:competence/damage-inducible protein A n=1 Tax=Salarchaeum sp. III TaxID=3107927 RepID=UPI002EDAC831